jgi:hypothetical protein
MHAWEMKFRESGVEMIDIGKRSPAFPVTPPFYYPQLRPLSLPILEDGDVGRDDFLHKGSCPSVIGGQAFHFREPVSWDIDDLRLLSAIFVGQPVGLGPGLCFTNTV